MRVDHDGMSLWYGTPDAPAPAETIQAGTEVAITVGVQPADASNKIEVQYRLNAGPTATVATKWLRTDSASKAQYFQTRLPAFRAGDRVEYIAVCRCAGRQAPSADEAEQLRSSFRVVDVATPEASSSALRNIPARALTAAARLAVNIGSADTGSRSPGDASVTPPSASVQPPNPLTSSAVPHRDDSCTSLATAGSFVIHGLVHANEHPVVCARVHAFDRDLPSLERRTGSAPQLPREAITDAEGRFQITYTLEQFQSGEGISPFRRLREKNADLSFRVCDRTGQELTIKRIEALDREYRSDQIIFNAPTSLEVSIFVDAPRALGTSEYEQLIALIAPVVADLPLVELSDEDVVFLSNELGLEQQREAQQRIEWLRRCALLAQESNLPIEAFYGWGRKNVPGDFAQLAEVRVADLPTVLKELIALEAGELKRTLLVAIAENIIPAALRDRFNDIIRQLKRRNQVSHEVIAQLKDAETGQVLAGYTVTTFDRSEGEENLGLDISDNQGKFFFSFYVPSVLPQDALARKFSFKIKTLAGDEIPEGEPVAIYPNQPETDVVKVSVNVPRPQLPELQEQLQQVQITSPELMTYLSEHREIKTFADIRRKGGINRLPDLPQLAPDILGKLESLVDLDRLSLKVLVSTVLIVKEYDSVLAIADAPRSEFVSAVKDTHEELTELEATKLHIMASAQTDFLNNLLVEMATNRANGFTR